VSPSNPWLQEAYGRGLIEAGRDVDAYAQYGRIVARWPHNTDALVNFGLLAHQLGHHDEAVDSWRRAVDIDPAQANAHLYLAQVLDQRGEPQAAARHYRAYLQIVAAHRNEHLGEKTTVLAALVKVADADAEANHDADALRGYNAAISFAAKSGDKRLESLALVRFAGLQEKQRDSSGAARSYQQALALDDSLSDPRDAASDWLNYGEFLRRQHQPERLVFACLLHAEDLLITTPGDELSTVILARKESEVKLGSGTASARRQHETLFKVALSLKREDFSSQQ